MDGGKQKRRRSPKQKVSGYNNYGSKIVFSKAATEQEFPHDVSVGRMISYLIGISLNLVIFAYLTQLKASDDCMCAEARGWMPTFLQYALAFSIMLIPFTMFLRTRIDIMAFMWQNGSLKALGLFAFGIGIIKAYAMLNYALDLYRCQCANDWRRLLMLWEGAISVLLYFALLSVILFLAIRNVF